MPEAGSTDDVPKREHEATSAEPTSVAPDTELAPPLTPVPATAPLSSAESIDVDLNPSSAREGQTGPNPTLASRDQTRSLPQFDSPRSSGKGSFGPDSGRATAAQVTKSRSKEGAHTTMQSVMRPELTSTGAPHSRRFLSIERELEQSTAAIKFLKKEQVRLQKGLRTAWVLAGVALLTALGSLYW